MHHSISGAKTNSDQPARDGQQRRRSSSSSNMNRPLDVVIFAASGTVGKFLVEELALVVDKHYSNKNGVSRRPSITIVPGVYNGNSSQLRDPSQFAQQTSMRRPSVPRHVDRIKWAIAGRSAVRLSEALCRAEISTGIRDLSTQVPVLLADLNHRKSLVDMCQKTRLVINCAGPYSELNAECLIDTCLECQTNYLDLSHETTFIELIRRKYSHEARQQGVFIINGCGFQAMSAEMGLNFTKQVADGQVDEIKIILSLSDTKAHFKTTTATGCTSSSSSLSTPKSILGRVFSRWTTSTCNLANNCGTISLGMWRSLIQEKSQEVSLEQRLKLKCDPRPGAPTGETATDNPERRRSLGNTESHSKAKRLSNPKILERKDTQSLVKDIVQFKNQNSLAWLQLFQGFNQNGRGYCCPMGSLISDEAQLIRGEMSNYELRRPDLSSPVGWRPIRCSSFTSMKSLLEICLALVWIFVFRLLVKWSPFRLLMRQFPTICSLGFVNGQQYELDRDSLSHIKYCQTFIAYGTPSEDSGDPLEQRHVDQMRRQEQLLVARIVGPEPNYIATATYAIQAALALCLERDHLPCKGGVLTPGVAFSETNIIYQLRRRNIKFEVLKKA